MANTTVNPRMPNTLKLTQRASEKLRHTTSLRAASARKNSAQRMLSLRQPSSVRLKASPSSSFRNSRPVISPKNSAPANIRLMMVGLTFMDGSRNASIRNNPALGNHIASGGIVGDGLRQAVFVQHAHLPPEEQGRHRHDDEDLEEYPDVDAGENAIECVDVRVREAQTHRLVDAGRGEEEQRHIARELVPNLVRVVER